MNGGINILVIADIEGSSGCWSRESASLFGRGWPEACREMSLDVRAVTRALFAAGAGRVRIQDFHRTGHNLFPDLMPAQAELVQGYCNGPVPGMADPKGFHLLMMMGMHAPSGIPGFLSHTLTSRIARVTANGAPISEAQLFAAALADTGLRPAFFSGCPGACAHTRAAMPGLSCFPIDKGAHPFDRSAWRQDLAAAAARAVARPLPLPYAPQGPVQVRVSMAGGPKAARKTAAPWGYPWEGADILMTVPDLAALFRELTRMIYLTPASFRLLPLILPLYRGLGRASLFWAQKKAPVR